MSIKENKQKPSAVCFIGPSGSGKTTLANMLVKNDGFSFVRSTTTRQRRLEESEDAYHFISEDMFNDGIARGAFIEHVNIDGRLYGTEKTSLDKVITSDNIAIFVKDCKGAKALRRYMGKDVLIIGLLRQKKDLVAAINARDIPEHEKEFRIKALDDELCNTIHCCDVCILNDLTIDKAYEEVLSKLSM